MLDDKQTQLNLRVSDQLNRIPIIIPWEGHVLKILIVTDGYSGQFLMVLRNCILGSPQ